MVRTALLHAATIAATVFLGTGPLQAAETPCAECLVVRVGPPVVARGPFPDELDAPFTALKLPDGRFRGFSANGPTYAIDSDTLTDLHGPRRAVLAGSEPGGISDCGRWLTTAMPIGGAVLGMIHQERNCDYDEGRTDKSMAIAVSPDDGLSWTEPTTVISGRDAPKAGTITGEGDCTMIDGVDFYLYAYCLRNSDWQTIVARAPIDDPLAWRKFYDGNWSEPGLGGRATAIGFLGPGAGYLAQRGWVLAIATDPWFGGVRLSLSADKVSFVDLDEPLLTIDAADWDRPAATDLIAYGSVINPDTGSNTVGESFLLSYIYVPPGMGFESRYLVLHEVSLAVTPAPQPVQVGQALTRWVDTVRDLHISSTGPLTGDRQAYSRDAVVAYLLTRPPDGQESIKLAECSTTRLGYLDQMLGTDETCQASGYARERTAGWLYASEQPGSVPIYQCLSETRQTHFVSAAANCDGLGSAERLLGYGLSP